jgi:hypothetical protein
LAPQRRHDQTDQEDHRRIGYFGRSVWEIDFGDTGDEQKHHNQQGGQL